MSGREPRTATGLEDLYERFRLPVYRLLRGIVLDSRAAEELAWETFERAQKATREGKEASAAAWLHGIAVEVGLTHARRSRLGHLLRGGHGWRGAAAGDPDQQPSPVEQALRRLSPDQRALVLLSLYAGLSPSEVAAILKLQPETVDLRLQAAVQLMGGIVPGASPAEAN